MLDTQYRALIANEYPVDGDLLGGLAGSMLSKRMSISLYFKLFEESVKWAIRKKVKLDKGPIDGIPLD